MTPHETPPHGKLPAKVIAETVSPAVSDDFFSEKPKTASNGIPLIFSKAHLHELAKDNLPPKYRVSSAALDEVDRLIQTIIGEIISLSVQPKQNTLLSRDLETGLRKYKAKLLLDELGPSVVEVKQASARLEQLLENVRFEQNGRKNE